MLISFNPLMWFYKFLYFALWLYNFRVLQLFQKLDLSLLVLAAFAVELITKTSSLKIYLSQCHFKALFLPLSLLALGLCLPIKPVPVRQQLWAGCYFWRANTTCSSYTLYGQTLILLVSSIYHLMVSGAAYLQHDMLVMIWLINTMLFVLSSNIRHNTFGVGSNLVCC